MTRVVLTGASGFVGSHVLRHLLTETDWEIICPITFRHDGIPGRMASALKDRDASRVKVVYWDLRSPCDPVTYNKIGDIDYIYNVASLSNVDDSIAHAADFIGSNVALVTNMLEFARKARPKIFLHMSTDEVYGPAEGDYRHREWDTIKPSNPYSASKAAQEAIAFSYWRTFGTPLVITNTMNILGEMQDPAKFVPKTLRSILAGEPVTVHASPEGIPGSRFYLHARNLADAWLFLTRYYENHTVASYEAGDLEPDRYHIVGDTEVDNLSMVNTLAELVECKPLIQLVDFHTSRPGHDLRYALDGSKIASLGWRAPISLEEGLQRTIKWTMTHQDWLKR